MYKRVCVENGKLYGDECHFGWHEGASARVDGRPCDFGRLRRSPMVPRAKRRGVDGRRCAAEGLFRAAGAEGGGAAKLSANWKADVSLAAQVRGAPLFFTLNNHNQTGPGAGITRII